jgi:peptidoglycan/xylan/chitin deacetylase (PgdA/CDA1 family)
MSSILRVITRYWFVAALLVLLIPYQLGLATSMPDTSAMAPSTATAEPSQVLLSTPTASRSSTRTRTPRPTRTPTSSRTPTPTVTRTPTATRTPSPTATFTPTPTPLPTPDAVSRTARVPILMYHYISKPPADADAYRLDLSVTPENFEAQLAWLRSQGYQTVTLSDLVYHLSLGWPLPDKPIILTFDDGYRDSYTQALPLLKKYSYVGTFFLVTKPIDEGDPAYLTWNMVKEMHRAGMDLEPHGYRHYDLRDRDVDFLVYEIVAAKEAIEARTGETARFFSYPSGSYDDQTVAVLKSAYFWAAVTTAQGATHTSDSLFELSRIRMRGRYDLEDFATLLTLDW